jgi:hypothetical protein
VNNPRRYSLNISPRYAANWGVWEVCREIVCNAMDADSLFTQHSPDDNTLIVETSTEPTLAQLFMVGEGTKCAGGETIGQFGEGFKLAALAASRTSGASLVAETSTKRISFGIERCHEVDADGLVALIEDIDQPDIKGLRVSVNMARAGVIMHGRILDKTESGPIPKHDPLMMKIYVKGVWICDLARPSLYDWNLNNLTINRDRNIASETSIAIYMSSELEWGDNDAILAGLASAERTFETETAGPYLNANAQKKVAEAWVKLHGPNAVLKSEDHATNIAARRKGFKTVAPINSLIEKLPVPKADDVVNGNGELVALDPAPFTDQIARLRLLDSAIDAPLVTLMVFSPGNRNEMGVADIQENRLWLSDQLFAQGRELDLTRTYLHEMAHFLSGGASDGSIAFEDALDHVAGKLALQLLKETVKA